MVWTYLQQSSVATKHRVGERRSRVCKQSKFGLRVRVYVCVCLHSSVETLASELCLSVFPAPNVPFALVPLSPSERASLLLLPSHRRQSVSLPLCLVRPTCRSLFPPSFRPFVPSPDRLTFSTCSSSPPSFRSRRGSHLPLPSSIRIISDIPIRLRSTRRPLASSSTFSFAHPF